MSSKSLKGCPLVENNIFEIDGVEKIGEFNVYRANQNKPLAHAKKVFKVTFKTVECALFEYGYFDDSQNFIREKLRVGYIQLERFSFLFTPNVPWVNWITAELEIEDSLNKTVVKFVINEKAYDYNSIELLNRYINNINIILHKEINLNTIDFGKINTISDDTLRKSISNPVINYDWIIGLVIEFYGVGSYRYMSDDMNWLEAHIKNAPQSKRNVLISALKKFCTNISERDNYVLCHYNSFYSYPHSNYKKILVKEDQLIQKEFLIALVNAIQNSYSQFEDTIQSIMK